MRFRRSGERPTLSGGAVGSGLENASAGTKNVMSSAENSSLVFMEYSPLDLPHPSRDEQRRKRRLRLGCFRANATNAPQSICAPAAHLHTEKGDPGSPGIRQQHWRRTIVPI